MAATTFASNPKIEPRGLLVERVDASPAPFATGRGKNPIGQDLSVTRERIRQIEAKALRKLRHPSHSKRLEAFVES